jgi:hypothetical protein
VRDVSRVHLVCVPTLSEARQLGASIQVVQSLYGKIQTDRIHPFAGILTVLPWQIIPNRACARLVIVSYQDIWLHTDIGLKNCDSKPVFIENGRGVSFVHSNCGATQEVLTSFSPRLLRTTVRPTIQ